MNKSRKRNSSRSSSRSNSPVEKLLETETIKDFAVQGQKDGAGANPLKPILQKQAMASSALLEDILAEDNII